VLTTSTVTCFLGFPGVKGYSLLFFLNVVRSFFYPLFILFFHSLLRLVLVLFQMLLKCTFLVD